MTNILLVESDPVVASSIIELGKEFSCKVFRVAEPQEALRLADTNKIDLVITELALKGHSGFEFLYEFRSYRDWLDIPVVVYTSQQLDKRVLASSTWKYLAVSIRYKSKHTPRQLLMGCLQELQESSNETASR